MYVLIPIYEIQVLKYNALLQLYLQWVCVLNTCLHVTYCHLVKVK